MKKKVLIFVIALFGLIAITIGTAFAFFTFTKNGSTENTIRAGNIVFHYDEISGKGRGINLIDALPVESDEEEKGSDNYFDFRITANSSMAQIPYVITTRLSEDSNMDTRIVKIYLTKVDENNETELLYTTLDQLEARRFLNNTDRVLYRDTVPVNGQNYDVSYRLRMWIAEGTNFMSEDYDNQRLSLTVNVYTNDGESLTAEHLTKSDDTTIKMISANNQYLLTSSNDNGVDYEVVVPNEVNTVNFNIIEKNIAATSTVTELGQTLAYNENGFIRRLSTSSNFNVLTGDNYFKVRTTSADGTKHKDYILKVNRELSRDNNLTSLEVEGFAFDEPFDENTTTYHVTMEGDTLVLSGNKSDQTANIEGLETKNLVWGENTFTITVTPANPDAEPKVYTIIVNNVRPEAPDIVINGEEISSVETWSDGPQTIVLNEPGTAISGVDHYEYYTSNSSIVPTDITPATGTITTSPYSLTISDEGTTYVYYRTVSTSGHKSEWSNRKVVRIDTSVPTVTFAASDTKASGTWHGADFTLNINSTKTGDSNITTYYGTTSNPQTEGNSISVDTNSSSSSGTTYYAKACNQAGVCSDNVSYVAKLDKSAPTGVTIAAADGKGASNWHGKNSKLNLSATKNGPSDLTYYYGDTSTPTTQGNNITLSTLTEESGKTYYAKACNQAGLCTSNTSYTAKVADYLKDLILADNASTKDTIIPASELKYKFNTDSSSQYRNGLFKAPDTDGGYTYYFRGVVERQTVVIGGHSWNILRINGNDTIRIMAIGPASLSGQSYDYNGFSNTRTELFGWTNKGYANVTSSDAYYSNTNVVGNAKYKVDTWYNTYIKNNDNYKNIVTSGTYCQAAKVKVNASAVSTDGVSNKPSAEDYVPSFDCPMNDGNITNGKLTMNVGLISLDEYLMAGGKIANQGDAKSNIEVAVNFSGDFDTGTMTYAGGKQTFRIVDRSVTWPYGVTSNIYLVPVINLKSDTLAVKKSAVSVIGSWGRNINFNGLSSYQVVQ